MAFLSGTSARRAQAMEVAPPPPHGPRSKDEVEALWEAFKDRFKQNRGQGWRSKMSVYMKDVFGGRDGLLEYMRTGELGQGTQGANGGGHIQHTRGAGEHGERQPPPWRREAIERPAAPWKREDGEHQVPAWKRRR